MFLKRVWKKVAPNPLERLLKHAQTKEFHSFLICWNRGLGDIALGLYALVFRIRQIIPDAKITFLTRPDLAEGFSLLEGVSVICDKRWKRGSPIAVDPELKKSYDVLIDNPDPTYWVSWQIGRLVPRLKWRESDNEDWKKFDIPKEAIAIHVQTETNYGTEKNWPVEKWQKLFDKLAPQPIVLFGLKVGHQFSGESLIDLRGKTTFLEMVSIIKNRCKLLIAPDSGVMSLIYYLDTPFPIKVISIWADPRQGVLKQNVASPNPMLVHQAIQAPDEDMKKLDIDEVLHAAL